MRRRSDHHSMVAMKRNLATGLALVLFSSALSNAAHISVSSKALIEDPFDPSIKLDQYICTLHGDGATILSIDLEFTGNLWQVQTGIFGVAQITPQRSNVVAFPPNFQAADSHFLTPFFIPATPPSETPLVNVPWTGASGPSAFLRTNPVAFPPNVQSTTIAFAQIVVPAGGMVRFSGVMGVSNSTDPVAINGIILPEPSAIGIATAALARLFAVRRRRDARDFRRRVSGRNLECRL
jgi:hypothetical protein